jgi:hypothetical protein
MLEIDVVMKDGYDETEEKFVAAETFKVRLEHSLVSLSKWESLWEVPFLGKEEKTQKQTLSYIEMMLLDEIPPEVFRRLVERHIGEVNDYVSAKQTATTVPQSKGPANREAYTAELIYYWMIKLNIPVEFESWHLSRLLTLIRVINYKDDPKQSKMTSKDRRALNRARRDQHNTRG